MNDYERNKHLQALKNERLKELRKKENAYGKELANVYKNKQEEIEIAKNNEEILKVYNSKIEEIGKLEEKIHCLKEEYKKSKLNNEIQQKAMEDFLINLEEKRRNFNTFMKEKGKQAIEYMKEKKRKEEELFEGIHQLKKKKQVKCEQTFKEREIAKKYKEELDLKEDSEDSYIDPKTLYKKTQIYHPNGNKIDYSNSRFHSIVVIRHDDELKEKYINANEKAAIEVEKTKGRVKSKEKSLEKFKKEMNVNSLEIQKKLKAKENLKKLEDNLKGIRLKKVVNSSKKLNENNNRSNIPEEKQSIPLDKRLELLSQMCQETNNIAQQNIKKTYNEPITREIPIPEFISRLNPVDIKEYIQEDENEIENSLNFHVTHKNSLSQNNLPHKDLYSMKEIENILNIGNILEKNNIIEQNDNSSYKEITKPALESNKNYFENFKLEKNNKEANDDFEKPEKKILANSKRPKTSCIKKNELKQDDSESLFNLLKDKVDKKENNQKAGNVVNDFFNSIMKSEIKNQESLQKQIKENENFIKNNSKVLNQQPKDEDKTYTNNKLKNNMNSSIKPQVKKGEMIEFDFKNDKINTFEKEKIKENFVKEREKLFNDFRKNKEEEEKDNNKPPDEEKFSKEALFQKRKELLKKKDFKNK